MNDWCWIGDILLLYISSQFYLCQDLGVLRERVFNVIFRETGV